VMLLEGMKLASRGDVSSSLGGSVGDISGTEIPKLRTCC
jgi:hypothetical protein